MSFLGFNDGEFLLSNINFINLTIIILTIIPLIIGFRKGISSKTVTQSMISVIEIVEMIAIIALSTILIRKILFEESSKLYSLINPHIPANIKNLFVEREIFAYILFVPLLLFIFMNLANFILNPIYTSILGYLNKFLFTYLDRLPKVLKKIFGFIWSLPRAVFVIIITVIILNFSSYFTTDKNFTDQLNSSQIYKKVYELAIKPVLQSDLAKDIPLIINDAFAIEEVPEPNILPEDNNSLENKFKQNIRVIKYFNGVTLGEAVKSNDEIDNFARSLTSGKTTDTEKAKKIYDWISKNINYDKDKAVNIAKDSSAYSSGAKVAFYTKNGICFDYACLFIAMCRANNIKVSLVTGVGYNGLSWGDHAWNKFYSREENRWINVDTTFGTVSNYFDKKNFYNDHRYEKVQAEW